MSQQNYEDESLEVRPAMHERPYFLLACIGLGLGLWGLSWLLISRYLPDLVSRGQFGDMFGAVNALFSGLALGGVIYALILQRAELRTLRQQLSDQRRAQRAQDDQLALQSEISLATIRIQAQTLIVKLEEYELKRIRQLGRAGEDREPAQLKKLDIARQELTSLLKSTSDTMAQIRR